MSDGLAALPRVLRLLLLLRSGGRWDVAAIGGELGVSERTVYRDLDRLKDAGIRVSYDEGRGGYLVEHGCLLPPLDLTAEETAALALLARRAGNAEPEPLARPTSMALMKLRAALPEAFRDDLDAVLPRVTVVQPAGEDGAADDVWAIAAQAISTRCALRCVYEPAGGSGDGVHAEPFRFDPYELYFGQRAWYAIGMHHGREGIRSLKLSRFARAELSDDAFEVPEGFSARSYFGRAWRMIPGPERHEVRLRFEPAFAETAADTRWHPTQEEAWLDDGSVMLSFEVDGLDEIEWWVLGYGPGCVVEAPRELAERVADLAKATAERYKRHDDESSPIE